MNLVPIKELIEKPISGEWGREPENDEAVKVLRTTNFTNIGKINYSKEVVCRQIDARKIEQKKLNYGDIIIEKSGGSPTQPVGRVVYFDKHNDIYLCNNFTSIIRAKNKVESKYLFYALYYNHKLGITSRYQNKTTGIINLKLDTYLEKVKIVVPSLEQQKIVIRLLDQAQSLIDKRKQQIELLDQLAQSVFLDMFGDPRLNNKNWETRSIENVFEVKTGGTPSRKIKDYWINGTIPWVKTTEVKENIIFRVEEYITEKGLQNSNAVLFPKDTILIAMYGQGKTRGKTAMLGIEATTNQACAAILPNNKCNMKFIWHQLLFQYETIRDLGRGGNQPNLNLSLIKSFNLVLPPLEEQEKYAVIVTNIEDQKERLSTSLSEINNLFNSLMQRAFRGELFND